MCRKKRHIYIVMFFRMKILICSKPAVIDKFNLLADTIRMGIRIPAEIGFAGKGANINLCGATYHGAMKVAARMLSYGYLWESIRMKGGAYGAGLTVSGNGDVAFTSFRDPNAANSLEIFDKAGAALRAICESNEPLDRDIVSTIASIEPLLSVRQKGIRAAQDYLGSVTWERICRERSEILCTTKEDLMRVIYVLNQVCEKGGVCVIGGKSSLDAVSTILEQQEL